MESKTNKSRRDHDLVMIVCNPVSDKHGYAIPSTYHAEGLVELEICGRGLGAPLDSQSLTDRRDTRVAYGLLEAAARASERELGNFEEDVADMQSDVGQLRAGMTASEDAQ